ncbi:MAG: Uma2 family endonuclease [Planctomycetes bacterium]|nr:Uma2 family endonuclease [Planctomycetota bacterium]
MNALERPRARHLLLHGVDWRTYSRLLRIFAERPSIRLTYDRGTLEMMAPLHAHESDGRFLGRLAVTATEELGLPVKAGGSTTFRRKKHARGLEPDDCLWIASEPMVRGKRHIDLRVDPPPDLAIEVDVASSSLDRMSIYAVLKVPEVWRLDALGLKFFILDTSGEYVEAAHSLAFPCIAAADLLNHLQLRNRLDENAVIRQFREWLREHLEPRDPTTPESAPA